MLTPTWTDPSQNFMERYIHPLDAIFHPSSVAVIGAKDDIGSVGRTIMLNLLSEKFKGRIYPINPKRSEVLGIKAYPSIAQVPESVDLAVIVTPAKTVPAIIKECVEAKVRSAIIISAGFKEIGPEGQALEDEVLRYAEGKLPIIGPNCLGVMNPLIGLNATFAKGMALPGNIAFISQSGAMCSAVLDWSLKEHIGFSAFVSIGSMADVDWGQLIDYLGSDPDTKSILMYMETIGDPRSFLSAAREIALEKPIIVIKPGRSQEAAKAAASHTGSLAGSDEVLQVALNRVGVLRVDTIAELFNMAAVLGRQPRPKGPRLTIVTNAGGPSVLATDATIINGASIEDVEPSSIEKLNAFLPDAWSHRNPVDILGDASAKRYLQTIDVLANDQNTDGLLVVLSPQDMTDPIGTAESLRPYAHLKDKPILASWMGGSYVSKGIEILNQAGIPTFEYPDDAAWSFATMWHYAKSLKTLYEVPFARHTQWDKDVDTQAARQIIHQGLDEKRELLTEFESKKLLQAYQIPIVETVIATNVEKAVEAAEKLGFPIVVKLHSELITHKSDVGGVKLNLKNAQDVANAYREIEERVLKDFSADHFQGVTVQKMIKMDGYELILGSSIDYQFGPVILFGAGGILVEIFKDKALGLPPLNRALARHLIEQTKISHALKGVRGKASVDLENLEAILVRFSQMIVENPWIKECDINPLMASAEGIIALDARVVLFDSSLKEKDLPRPAIRPYPVEYIFKIRIKDNEELLIRPIRPEDEMGMIEFHQALSENTVRQRYFEFRSLDERITHERLIRICFNDFDREIAIVATHQGKIVGVARLIRQKGGEGADLKMTIIDAYHGKGLGAQLIEKLIAISRNENIQTIHARILAENTGMIHLCQKYGFKTTFEENNMIVDAQLNL